MVFSKVYYIWAGQASLQVQCKFYNGTCFYVACYRKYVKLIDSKLNVNILIVSRMLIFIIPIVPEEGWFGQTKYSTPSKKPFYVVSVSASL